MGLCELVERYGEIIEIQKGVIDELFLLLYQYVDAGELDKLPVNGQINRAAAIRRELD